MKPIKHKILVVDDNEINRLICTELLEDHYQLEYAVDGEQAIEKAAEFDPDLVLLDVMMPGIDGIKTCRRLRTSARPWVKIILVSAKVQTSDRLAGYDAGADDYVGKPFDEDELLAKIRIHLKLKRTEEVDELKYNVLRAMQHGNRTPITKILCRSEMLIERQGELSDESMRDARFILKATRGLHQWLTAAQTLIELKSDMMEVETEVVEIESVIEKAIKKESRTDQRFQDQVDLRLDSSHMIHGDVELLETLFRSVLKDSLERTENDAIVSLSIKTESDTFFTIIISYAGERMSPEQIHQAFEPFGVPDDVLFNRGDGMSLSIVQEITALHGGEIKMDSTEANVTLVAVTLPRYQSPQDGNSSSNSAERSRADSVVPST